MFISDAILKEKAMFFAHGLGLSENTLTFSNGWLMRFKKKMASDIVNFMGNWQVLH
jgi:hypothetical protein